MTKTSRKLVNTRRLVLYVNDQPHRDEELFTWLESRGAAVIYAADTRTALGLAEKVQLDAVVTDLARVEGDVFQKMAGMELARALKSRATRVPICVYTNDKSPAIHELAEDAGADFVTEKPTALLAWLAKQGI